MPHYTSIGSFGLAAALAATLLSLPVTIGGADAASVTLAPHRAVYDLKLARAQGRRPVEAVRGRILYDFAGNSCEGYALQFRQVSELDAGEGRSTFSDLRATTWEDGSAKNFRFASQNFLDSRLWTSSTAAPNASLMASPSR